MTNIISIDDAICKRGYEPQRANMDYYHNLINKLEKVFSTKEKLLILLNEKIVIDYLDESQLLKLILPKLSLDEQYAILCLIILGQGDYVFNLPPDFKGDLLTLLKDLAKDLLSIERFYSPIGGIIGYHLSFLKLLNEKEHIFKQKNLTFNEPSYFDIQKNTQEVEKFINAGLENLPQTALISPMGGSADRLKLYDVKSKMSS
ncbi:MAG: hypothetical protein HZB76_03625 [Chlamydiae bacterium]|nr:hypothetical protein [Chlamydiota bacterium]